MFKPKFKQRCVICKKNMVMMYSSRQFPICADCHMKRISDPVEDPHYKKLLSISDDLYRKSSFLRNIKESFLRFGSLTENQVNAFKKAVEDLKKPKPAEEVAEDPIEITDNPWGRKKKISRGKIKTPFKKILVKK